MSTARLCSSSSCFRRLLWHLLLALSTACGSAGAGAGAQPPAAVPPAAGGGSPVRYGSEVLLGSDSLLGRLRGQRIAVVANHTAQVFDRVHLVDTLRALGLDLRKVFAPEHGFRGDADAGASIRDGADTRSGLPVVSLYGSTKKPTPAMLADVDVVLFDIQDVGTRFYTYLSTLAYVQEACAEQGKALWVLDRPNPNGMHVGGPLLDTARHRSFVGLHPIPILHGMTLGEYARLLNGESWLAGGRRVALTVVPAQGYRHRMRWEATGRTWVPPSPNLRTPTAARLYPYLCWYEGTPVSVGRGTDRPFEVTGMPLPGLAFGGKTRTYPLGCLTGYVHAFTPEPRPGAGQPMYHGLTCSGIQLADVPADCSTDSLYASALRLLRMWQQEHQRVPQAARPGPFFQPFFTRLAGTDTLARQVAAGTDPAAIVAGWAPQVVAFRAVRARYLLYPDD